MPVVRPEKHIIENSSIGFARLPFKFLPNRKESQQGVNLTGANIFNDTIFRGAGIKVAVVDVGFKGLTAAISAGEVACKCYKPGIFQVQGSNRNIIMALPVRDNP